MGVPKIWHILSIIIIVIIFTSFLLLHQQQSIGSLVGQHVKVKMGAFHTVDHEARQPRILCWILTGVENHMSRAIHVKRTWGSRCDILLFMSSQLDENLGTIVLPGVKEGWENLWPKTVKAFQYVWEHHRDDADWFMKADDDTWVFVDNLRSLLGNYDENEPHYLGLQGAKTERNETYHFGGTGYLVSKEALRLFIMESLPHEDKCYPEVRSKFQGWEDGEFGECMLSVGVLPETVIDKRGRARFIGYNPVESLVHEQDESRLEEILNDTEVSPITYHKVKPRYMYVLEYMTRNLK